MNKREIISWLEYKRNHALKAAKAHYEKIKQQEEEKILQDTDFFTMANKMQQFLEKAVQAWDDWTILQSGHPTMQIDRGYCYFIRELRMIVKDSDGASKYLEKHAINFRYGRFDEIFDEEMDAANKTLQSYQKVIDAVSRSRSSKEAMEFVVSLGFDLAEIEQDMVPTASRLEIETVYLFPEKANKDEKKNAA